MVAARKKSGDTGRSGGEGGAFEDQLKRLEALVERMEGNGLALEEAIALFEEGMGLSRSLLDRLEQAEKRVELLVRKSRAEVERRELDADEILEGGQFDAAEDDDEENGR